MNVLLEPDPKAKRELQERITGQLPQWFGKVQANAKYAALAETLDGYIAEIGGIRCGLLMLKYHGKQSAEVCWMVSIRDAIEEV